MTRQPDFITKEMVRSALERAKKEKHTPLPDKILFDTNQDGKCIEILNTALSIMSPHLLKTWMNLQKK